MSIDKARNAVAAAREAPGQARGDATHAGKISYWGNAYHLECQQDDKDIEPVTGLHWDLYKDPEEAAAALDRAWQREDAKPTTHGGARPNAGRKPIDAEDPTERHNLTAPASIWRLLERLGNGNRSEGLRILADLHTDE